jgi:hypothetical protein
VSPAERDRRRYDCHRLAHVHQQAGARIQVPELGGGVPVGMPSRGGISIDRQEGEVAVVSRAAGGPERRRVGATGVDAAPGRRRAIWLPVGGRAVASVAVETCTGNPRPALGGQAASGAARVSRSFGIGTCTSRD